MIQRLIYQSSLVLCNRAGAGAGLGTITAAQLKYHQVFLWNGSQIMKYKIPHLFLSHFVAEALKNKVANGHIETLAICIGKIEENCGIVEELIFPSQEGSTSFVEDIGK